MALCAELTRVESALQALSHAADGVALRAALRQAERAADDAECAADETRDAELAARLRSDARGAREAAARARASARDAAREAAYKGRTDLLGDHTANREPAEAAGAARLAEDIKASLRRSTAVLHEELARSNAAGDIVDDSSRRLRKTLEVHRDYGDHVQSGSKTLRELKREELKANVAIVQTIALPFRVLRAIARAIRSFLPTRVKRQTDRLIDDHVPCDEHPGMKETFEQEHIVEQDPGIKETFEQEHIVGGAELEHAAAKEALPQARVLGGVDEL